MKRDNKNTEYAETPKQDEISIKELVLLFFQHRIWFIVSTIVFLSLGVLYVKTKPNIYARKATVIVEDEKRGGSTSEAAAFQEIFNMGGGSVYNEIGLFKSIRYMSEVAKRLDLEVSYRVKDGLRTKELYKSTPFKVTFDEILPDQAITFIMKLIGSGQAEISELTFYDNSPSKNHIILDDMVVNIGDSVVTDYGSFIITPTLCANELPIGEKLYVTRLDPEYVARAYNEILNVALVDKYASLVTISISDESINRAEDIINTLITVYSDDAIDDKNTILSNTTKFIDERLSIIEADLKAVDDEIEAYKRDNKLTDVISEGTMFLESVTRIDEESLNVLNQLSIVKYMKSYLEDESKVDELLPVNVGIADPGLQSQISLYNESMARRNKLVVNSSANNPLVADIQAMLVNMRSSILLSLNNSIASLEIRADNYLRKESESLSKIKDLPSQQRYLISVQRQQTIKEQLYLYLLNKKEESELQRSITESNCRIVDYAVGKSRAVAPHKKLIVFFCFFLGLAIPAAIIYFFSKLNTAVNSRRDIKSAVSIPFLGDIPTEKVSINNQLVVAEGSRSAVSEAFKIIRDNIDFMSGADDKRGKVLQLTSLNPSSGKTFVTVNMAMSMALGGAKVVIVDLDIRKGTLSKVAGVGVKQVGVTQYLNGRVTNIGEIIRPYAAGVPFDIISSGILPPNPAELLKGDKLPAIFDELRAMYDYIIVDNPPYGVVVDAAICARVCDQSIYVIRAGKFDKSFLADVQELYDNEKLPNMSLLLNGVNSSSYSYGYGYGYGDGAENKKSWIRQILGI